MPFKLTFGQPSSHWRYWTPTDRPAPDSWFLDARPHDTGWYIQLAYRPLDGVMPDFWTPPLAWRPATEVHAAQKTLIEGGLSDLLGVDKDDKLGVDDVYAAIAAYKVEQKKAKKLLFGSPFGKNQHAVAPADPVEIDAAQFGDKIPDKKYLLSNPPLSGLAGKVLFQSKKGPGPFTVSIVEAEWLVEDQAIKYRLRIRWRTMEWAYELIVPVNVIENYPGAELWIDRIVVTYCQAYEIAFTVHAKFGAWSHQIPVGAKASNKLMLENGSDGTWPTGSKITSKLDQYVIKSDPLTKPDPGAIPGGKTLAHKADKSFLFSGPKNTAEMGKPIPMVTGKVGLPTVKDLMKGEKPIIMLSPDLLNKLEQADGVGLKGAMTVYGLPYEMATDLPDDQVGFKYPNSGQEPVLFALDQSIWDPMAQVYEAIQQHQKYVDDGMNPADLINDEVVEGIANSMMKTIGPEFEKIMLEGDPNLSSDLLALADPTGVLLPVDVCPETGSEHKFQIVGEGAETQHLECVKCGYVEQ